MKPNLDDHVFVTCGQLSAFATIANVAAQFEGDELVLDAIARLGIEAVYLITYRTDGRDCCAHICMHADGGWSNLQGQIVTVTACRTGQ